MAASGKRLSGSKHRQLAEIVLFSRPVQCFALSMPVVGRTYSKIDAQSIFDGLVESKDKR